MNLALTTTSTEKLPKPDDNGGVYSLDCCRLHDGTISVRIDDQEVVLIPVKRDCTSDVLERAIRKICAQVDAIWQDCGYEREAIEEKMDW